MRKNTLLLVLIAIGSALCWWPAIIEPSIDFSRWIPLAILPLLIVLATALSDGRWLRLVVASVFGTFTGLCAGFIILPFTDVISHTYWAFGVLAITLAAILVAFVAVLAGQKLTVSNDNGRRAVWLALAGCVSFG